MATKKRLEDGLKHIHKITPALVEKALGRAGTMLLTDASTLPPKTPHDEGTLRASGSVLVSGKLFAKATPGGLEGGKPEYAPVEGIQNESTAATIVCHVGFNTPYAARLHENPQFSFKESGTGGKFLASKMQQRPRIYFQEISRVLKTGIDITRF